MFQPVSEPTRVLDPASAHSASIELWLIERIACYLQRAPHEIRPDTPLDEIGLDSVYALTLCGEIEEVLHLTVEPTIAWDYPTVAEIARELDARLAQRSAQGEAHAQ
ncbi:polyketide synthase [Burkholderia pseudomallei]|nr:polyketide synthase [Burkholderia pseudomallei]